MRGGDARRAVTLSLVAATLVSCAWRAEDKALFGGYLLLSGVDLWQTAQGERRGATELNPLLASSDGKPDLTKVTVMKVAGSLVIAGLLDRLEEKDRRDLLWVANGLQGGVVGWNAHVLSLHEPRPMAPDPLAPTPSSREGAWLLDPTFNPTERSP